MFISASERVRESSVLERLKGSSILTVGETDGFIRCGGVIGFITDNNKIAFEVNVAAAKKNKLKISSKLLNLAKTVLD